MQASSREIKDSLTPFSSHGVRQRAQPRLISRSVLELGLICTSSTTVSPNVVEVHGNAAHAHEEKQTGVYPMACRIALGGFIGLVNPDADDLSWSSHGDVERDG